ncbi:MAG: polyprenyl diphosphate synthase [Candidatus Saccharibacteria bacterium]|nr:polyprenyl diphosphate synthase [Candidatus Saccharibacteria bacterium]
MNETIRIVPEHVGVIVDGNRRWAKEHGLPTAMGHKRGYEVLKEIAYACKARGVKYMSAYIFSTENWQRSEEEVGYLMKLFLTAFKQDADKFINDGFRIIFLGRRNRVRQDILDIIDDIERRSAGNTEATLALYFNYGGRAEFIDAACHLAADVQAGRVNLAEMTDDRFRQYLYQPELPDIDMMVRTSGEQRVSGFALWRIAYSEIMFLDKKWPDMTESDIDNIIDEYNHRNRRFGK